MWLESHRLGWLEWPSKRQGYDIEIGVYFTSNVKTYNHSIQMGDIPLAALIDEETRDWKHRNLT